MSAVLGAFSFDRVVSAVEKVRQRLYRAAAALEGAKVPYAIVGGNAVALWVSRVDEAAVRNTQDVDVLLRRSDLGAAKRVLEGAGFVHAEVSGVDVFLDGPDVNVRDSVHVLFANEKVKAYELAANPDVSDSVPGGKFQVLSLEALVQIKLTAFRDKDRVHLRDMIGVGLIDRNWPSRFPPELGERLQTLLNDPNG
jgi:hypothetical protein